MNERIKELAEQAQQHAEYVTPQGLEWFDTFKEKFAELIVEECDSIIEKYSKANMESDSWVAMISMMQKELKQHFGVE